MCEPIFSPSESLVILVSNDSTQEDIDKILKNLSYIGSFVIKDMSGNLLYKQEI